MEEILMILPPHRFGDPVLYNMLNWDYQTAYQIHLQHIPENLNISIHEGRLAPVSSGSINENGGRGEFRRCFG